MSQILRSVFTFGPYRMHSAERLLLRDGVPVPLPPKAFDVLHVLLNNPGRLLDKGYLMEAIWPGIVVEEVNLAQNVSLLRKVLREREDGISYIETVPKYGYRFVAAVEVGVESNQE